MATPEATQSLWLLSRNGVSFFKQIAKVNGRWKILVNPLGAAAAASVNPPTAAQQPSIRRFGTSSGGPSSGSSASAEKFAGATAALTRETNDQQLNSLRHDVETLREHNRVGSARRELDRKQQKIEADEDLDDAKHQLDLSAAEIMERRRRNELLLQHEKMQAETLAEQNRMTLAAAKVVEDYNKKMNELSFQAYKNQAELAEARHQAEQNRAAIARKFELDQGAFQLKMLERGNELQLLTNKNLATYELLAARNEIDTNKARLEHIESLLKVKRDQLKFETSRVLAEHSTRMDEENLIHNFNHRLRRLQLRSDTEELRRDLELTKMETEAEQEQLKLMDKTQAMDARMITLMDSKKRRIAQLEKNKQVLEQSIQLNEDEARLIQETQDKKKKVLETRYAKRSGALDNKIELDKLEKENLEKIHETKKEDYNVKHATSKLRASTGLDLSKAREKIAQVQSAQQQDTSKARLDLVTARAETAKELDKLHVQLEKAKTDITKDGIRTQIAAVETKQDVGKELHKLRENLQDAKSAHQKDALNKRIALLDLQMEHAETLNDDAIAITELGRDLLNKKNETQKAVVQAELDKAKKRFDHTKEIINTQKDIIKLHDDVDHARTNAQKEKADSALKSQESKLTKLKDESKALEHSNDLRRKIQTTKDANTAARLQTRLDLQNDALEFNKAADLAREAIQDTAQDTRDIKQRTQLRTAIQKKLDAEDDVEFFDALENTHSKRRELEQERVKASAEARLFQVQEALDNDTEIRSLTDQTAQLQHRRQLLRRRNRGDPAAAANDEIMGEMDDDVDMLSSVAESANSISSIDTALSNVRSVAQSMSSLVDSLPDMIRVPNSSSSSDDDRSSTIPVSTLPNNLGSQAPEDLQRVNNAMNHQMAEASQLGAVETPLPTNTQETLRDAGAPANMQIATLPEFPNRELTYVTLPDTDSRFLHNKMTPYTRNTPRARANQRIQTGFNEIVEDMSGVDPDNLPPLEHNYEPVLLGEEFPEGSSGRATLDLLRAMGINYINPSSSVETDLALPAEMRRRRQDLVRAINWVNSGVQGNLRRLHSSVDLRAIMQALKEGIEQPFHDQSGGGQYIHSMLMRLGELTDLEPYEIGDLLRQYIKHPSKLFGRLLERLDQDRVESFLDTNRHVHNELSDYLDTLSPTRSGRELRKAVALEQKYNADTDIDEDQPEEEQPPSRPQTPPRALSAGPSHTATPAAAPAAVVVNNNFGSDAIKALAKDQASSGPPPTGLPVKVRRRPLEFNNDELAPKVPRREQLEIELPSYEEMQDNDDNDSEGTVIYEPEEIE